MTEVGCGRCTFSKRKQTLSIAPVIPCYIFVHVVLLKSFLFCFLIRVPEFSHGDVKLWPDSDSEVWWYQHISPQLPQLHHVQNKVVEGRWTTPSRSYNISFANDRDAKPYEANAISTIEIDHINQFSRLAHNHSFEKAATDSGSCSRRKLSFESARKLCRVSLENSYRSLHYSRRCRFTAGVNTRHTSRGRHYFMIDPL